MNTPINEGLLQSDLDCAGFDLLNFDGGSGTGLPAGGTTGQLLQKQSSADGDADWAGGGDVTPLEDGRSYIEVSFDTVQSADWEFTFLVVVNTIDESPLNILPGTVTARSTTGFRLQLVGTPDSANYDLHWSFTGTGGGSAVVSVDPLPGSATVEELMASVGMTRTPIAALATGLGNFFDSQSMDPCIVVNPNNSTQLIMLFTGFAAPLGTGQQTLGRATANVSDPTTWTVSNGGSPVVTATESYETGAYGLRADGLLYNPADGKLYLFYTAKESGTFATCALATSTDLGLTWTKLGQILTPTAPEETCSGLSVVMEGTTLHGVYSYRVASQLLHYRYASASTSNWLSWTKGGVDVYTESSRDLEYHKLLKIGSTYLLVYESGSFSPGVDWDIRFATSTSPSTAFTASPDNPLLVKSGTVGAFDEFHVATPQVVVIDGYYYLFFCGAMDHAYPVTDNHWQMGVVPLGY